MATKIVGEDGDLRWSPSTFGSYSVEKTQQIVDILKDLISTITIDVNIDDDQHRNYYTKQEIDERLVFYFLKQDFQDFLGDKVSDLIGQYILSQEAVGRIVSTDTTNRMKKVMNYLTKICFDETYDVMEAQEDFPIPTSYFYRMDNLEGRTSTVENQADTLCNDLYSNPSQRTGFRALRDTSIVTVSEDSSTKIPSASLEYSLRQIVDTLCSDLYTNPIQRSGFRALRDTSIVTSSTDDNTKIPSASLEYSLRNTVSELNTTVTGIGSRVSTLETNVGSMNDKVPSLNQSYSTFKDQLVNKLAELEQRIQALESRV